MSTAVCRAALQPITRLDVPGHRRPAAYRGLVPGLRRQGHHVSWAREQAESARDRGIAGARRVHEEMAFAAVCIGGDGADCGHAFTRGAVEPLQAIGVADTLDEASAGASDTHGVHRMRTIHHLRRPSARVRIVKAPVYRRVEQARAGVRRPPVRGISRGTDDERA